jgi:hypothetical protein
MPPARLLQPIRELQKPCGSGREAPHLVAHFPALTHPASTPPPSPIAFEGTHGDVERDGIGSPQGSIAGLRNVHITPNSSQER